MAELPEKVAIDSTVSLAYRLLAGDVELESASESEPISLQLGQGEWPVQVELALVGEAVGAKISAAVPADEQAFGEYEAARVQRLAVDEFEDALPNVGDLMTFELPSGEAIEGLVISADKAHVDVDFNHPYAGRDLVFEMQIVAIAGPS